MNIKSEIQQIEEIKLKDIDTIGELIDYLKKHKRIYNHTPSYYESTNPLCDDY